MSNTRRTTTRNFGKNSLGDPGRNTGKNRRKYFKRSLVKLQEKSVVAVINPEKVRRRFVGENAGNLASGLAAEPLDEF